MRAKLLFALLFVSLLWAGTAALGQKSAAVPPALPYTVPERCTLPEQRRPENAGRCAASTLPARQHVLPGCGAQPVPPVPVQTACHYRMAYQAFHLIGEAG